MNKVYVNGKKYILPNGNVSVVNNKVYWNGKLVEDCYLLKEKIINITIEGNVEGDVKCDNIESINIKGSCKNIETNNGEVKIGGNVDGNVSTYNGNVNCHNINGDAKTHNGNINKSFFSKLF